ncbi:MAG: class I SAM-dependent methyltransferase [Candidatus Micrarchaeia archaeon]
MRDSYFEAGYYHATLEKPSKKYHMVEEFFKRHGVRKVLDVGCGAGRHTYLLAKAGFDVYGFDISMKALQINKKLLKKHKVHAKLRRWDMLKAWPYKTGFFDAVFASRVMYQFRMKEIKKNVNEVRRVLKKGGYLFWEGPTYKTTGNLFYKEKLKFIEPGTWLSIGGPYDGHAYHRFKDKKEVTELLKGFKMLRFDFRGATFSLIAKKIE